MTPRISLIIPTYNRKDILIQNLKEIRRHYPEAEIIVVDDGSKEDYSLRLKQEFGNSIIFLKNEKNLGKGASLRKGFLIANGDYLIFTDDDLPYGLKAIDLIYQKLQEGAKIAVIQRSNFNDKNLFKKIARLIFKLIFQPLLRIHLQDTQAGLKGFKKEVGKLLFSLSFIDRFAIDLEILHLASKLKIKIETVPANVLNQETTTFKLSSIFEIALSVIKIKLHHYEKSHNY